MKIINTYKQYNWYTWIDFPKAIGHGISVDMAHSGARDPFNGAPTLPNLKSTGTVYL